MVRDALIVGVNRYQFLPGLNSPAHDAEAIAQVLQTYGDFRVSRLPEVVQSDSSNGSQLKVGQKTPVTLRQVESALVKLFKPRGCQTPQTALFYFSGHGMQRDAGIQEGYLALSDSQPDVGFSGLSLFWLRRLLQESPVPQRIVILDCCHSGELLNFLEADPGARPGTDRLFMVATRDYDIAYESLNSSFSTFTQALLDGLDPRRQSSGVVTNYSLTAWVSQALKAETQQPLFENSGSEIILTRCGSDRPAPLAATPAQQTSEICPYRGLAYFEERHADFFFGRDELCDRLIARLQANRFVAVVGPSGSGKSSLVRAGLVARLRRGQAFVGSDRWRIRLITPTEHPLKSLASAFVDLQASDLERAEQLQRAETFLQNDANGLARLVQANLLVETSTGLGDRPHFLLVIDQFEEVFTLGQGQGAAQERRQFFAALAGAIQSAAACSIVIVLRADFLGQCAAQPPLAGPIEQHQFLVPPLTYEQIKSTILHPAQKVGLHCDANLVYALLLDVVGAPGELPLLQYTLLELWQRRRYHAERQMTALTLDTYTELGGIRGALQRRATEVFMNLTPDEQQVAQRIFLALTQLGDGTEDARRRVSKAELLDLNFPQAVVEATLEKLIAAKLVVSDRLPTAPAADPGMDAPPSAPTIAPSGGATLAPLGSATDSTADPPIACPTTQETVDVAHETLIRHWSLLRRWLAENRTRLWQQRGIEQAAREWTQAGCPTTAGYLLQGSRLINAEEFLAAFPEELSPLARKFIAASRANRQQARMEMHRLQVALPTALVMALLVTFSQFHAAVRTEAEKNQQQQIARSREYAAIAQSILQEPGGNPMTALRISRLASGDGPPTYEAQASMRAALQQARLQVNLAALPAPVSQIAVSPNQSYLAAMADGGTVHVWQMAPQTIYTAPPALIQVLTASQTMDAAHAQPGANRPAATEKTATEADLASPWRRLTFSPDGRIIAAIAPTERRVHLWLVETGSVQHTINSEHPIRHIQYSPDGRWLLLVTDFAITLWNLAQARSQGQIPHEGVLTMAFSPDGTSLLWGSQNGVLRRWPLPPGEAPIEQVPLAPTPDLTEPGNMTTLSLNPTAAWVASRDASGVVNLWSTQIGQLYRRLTYPPTAAAPVSETDLATGDAWSLITQRLSNWRDATKPFPGATALLTNAAGQWLVEAHADVMRVWDILAGELQMERRATTGWVSEASPRWGAIALSPDGQTLATITHLANHPTYPQVLTLWNGQTGQEIAMIPVEQAITTLQFTPDGTYLITGGDGGAVQLWAVNLAGELPTIPDGGAAIGWASFLTPTLPNQPPADPTGDGAIAHLATLTAHGTLQHWQISTNPMSGSVEPAREVGQPNDLHPAHQPAPELTAAELPPHPVAAAISPSVNWWAIAPPTGQVALHQSGQRPIQHLPLVKGQPPAQPSAQASHSHSSPVSIDRLIASADGQQLLGIGDDTRLWLWEVPSGNLRQSLATPHPIETAALSRDSLTIATAHGDATVRLWETATGKSWLTLPQSDAILSLDFDPSGTLLAAGGSDGTTRLWHLPSGTVQRTLSGHQDGVLDVAFSPDGQWLTTTSQDGTARLWEVATGREQAHLRPMQPDGTLSPLVQAFFSPDGHYLATLNAAGQLHLWAATWESVLRLASDRSLRNLTPDECLQYLRLSPPECPTASPHDDD